MGGTTLQFDPKPLIAIAEYLFIVTALGAVLSLLVFFFLRDDDWTFSDSRRNAGRAGWVSAVTGVLSALLALIGIGSGLEAWVGNSMGKALGIVALAIVCLVVPIVAFFQIALVRALHSWLGRSQLDLSTLSVDALTAENRLIESKMARGYWGIVAAFVVAVAVTIWVIIAGSVVAGAPSGGNPSAITPPGEPP